MKILHIITRLILGGAQQNTVMCCAAQARAGHQVSLAFGPIYGPEGSLLPEAQKAGVDIQEVAAMRRAILPGHDWFTYRALRRLIRKLQPEVVHTHSSKAGIVGRAAAWAEHVPAVIHTIHGLPFHDQQPRFIYWTYVLIERWAAHRCHKLIGITEAMCSLFQQHGIGVPGQFEVVPSGVDIAGFNLPAGARETARQQLGIPLDAPVVGILARLDPLKGQADLIEILPELVSKHPGLKLLIVGDGWNRTQLEARVAQSGMRDQVIFTGLVSPDRVPLMLAAMDVNTLPSYQEGQARTLVQALLCGCGIVGYAVGGIPEVCIHGETGRLVPMGDKAGLVREISSLLSDPVERRRLAAQGAKLARDRFDSRIMIRRLEEIYATTLDASRKNRLAGVQF